MKRIMAAAVVGVSVMGMMLPAVTWGQATGQAAAKPARVAIIRLTDSLLERPASFSLSSLLGSNKNQALSTLIVRLNQATKDSSISGVLLDMSAFSLTLTQAHEVGELLTQARQAGKRVAVYSSDFDTPTYMLASYADTVIMPANGTALVPGVGLEMPFFKGTLDKLDVTADLIQMGKYKGAEEPFTRTSASPEYRAQIQKLVDGMYDTIISTISANRPNMTEAAVKQAIDEGMLSGARAKELGLVDQNMTRDRVDGWLESQFPAGASLVSNYGEAQKAAVDLNNPFALLSLLSGGAAKPQASGPEVAVIFAVGDIMSDSAGDDEPSGEVTPGMIRTAVDRALTDDQVKAIVLRVDSPGGSASASDEIWSVLSEANKKKPVTVSMGRVAASGGYYISCAGRHITADPATITGSIGVVGGKIVITGLLNKVGMNVETVSRGAHAQMLSMLTPFTDEERAFLAKTMGATYDVFKGRVTTARGDKVKDIEAVDQGRLFTGEQAKAAGLVDDIGTLEDTVKAAAKQAGIENNFTMLVLPETKTLADVLREGLDTEASLPVLGGLRADAVSAAVRELPGDLRVPAIHAIRMLNVMGREQVLMAAPGLIENDGGPVR